MRLFALRTRWTAAAVPLTREDIECAIWGFIVALAMTGALL